MEQMLVSELQRQKELLREKIQSSTGLDSLHIDSVLGDVESCLGAMMKLMKDGKSAHEKFFSDIIFSSFDAIIGLENNHRGFLWNAGAETLYG